MHELRYLRIVGHRNRRRLAVAQPKDRSGCGAVVADRTNDPIRRKLQGYRGNADRMIGFGRNGLRTGPRDRLQTGGQARGRGGAEQEFAAGMTGNRTHR